MAITATAAAISSRFVSSAPVRPIQCTQRSASPCGLFIRRKIASSGKSAKPGFQRCATTMGAADGPKGTVIPEPSFRLGAGCMTIAGIGGLGLHSLPVSVPFFLLGTLLLVQATRVRFSFSEDDLEVLIKENSDEASELEESTNSFVGGMNKWKYSSFVNWELWWPDFPILVYFKETQTKPEGQIHFFPVIMDGRELYKTMLERCGSTMNSGPKPEE